MLACQRTSSAPGQATEQPTGPSQLDPARLLLVHRPSALTAQQDAQPVTAHDRPARLLSPAVIARLQRSPVASRSAASPPTVIRPAPALHRSREPPLGVTSSAQPPADSRSILQPAPPSPAPQQPKDGAPKPSTKLELRENIYTIPNALTLGRILATPVIGYYVLQGELATATGLLFVAGLSDLVRSLPAAVSPTQLVGLRRPTGRRSMGEPC